MIHGQYSRIGSVWLGIGSIFFGLVLAVSATFTIPILQSGYIVTDRVITMFSPSGMPLAWALIICSWSGGALLVVLGSWFVRASFGSATRRRKAAHIALIVGVGLVAAVMIGSAFVAPAFAAITVTQATTTSQSVCSDQAFMVLTNGRYYYGFSGSACSLRYGGPQNVGGAIGTNASMVIDSVMSALNESGRAVGGVVSFSVGVFNITSSIRVPNGVTITGAGMNSTIFAAAPTLNAPVIKNAAAGTIGNGGVTLEGFQVTGKGDSNGGATGISWYASDAQAGSLSLRIDGVYVNDMPGDGLDTSPASAPNQDGLVVVTNSRFTNCKGTTMNLKSEDSKYTDVYAGSTSTTSPVVVVSGSTSTFIGDYFGWSNFTSGEEVYVKGGTVDFMDTIIDDAQGNCLLLQARQGFPVSDFTYIGGQITDCGEASSHHFSVDLNSYVSGAVFQDVTFYNKLSKIQPENLAEVPNTTVAGVEFIGCQIQNDSFAGGVVPVRAEGGGLYYTAAVTWVDNHGFNPVSSYYRGPIPYPMGVTVTVWTGSSFLLKSTIGLAGNWKTVVANTDYVVSGVNIKLSCSGGKGVQITEKTGAGGSIVQRFTSCSAMGTLYLWVGEAINFGPFSVAPAVQAFGD